MKISQATGMNTLKHNSGARMRRQFNIRYPLDACAEDVATIERLRSRSATGGDVARIAFSSLARGIREWERQQERHLTTDSAAPMAASTSTELVSTNMSFSTDESTSRAGANSIAPDISLMSLPSLDLTHHDEKKGEEGDSVRLSPFHPEPSCVTYPFRGTTSKPLDAAAAMRLRIRSGHNPVVLRALIVPQR